MKTITAILVMIVSALDIAGAIEIPEWVSAITFGIVLGIVIHTASQRRTDGQ